MFTSQELCKEKGAQNTKIQKYKKSASNLHVYPKMNSFAVIL